MAELATQVAVAAAEPGIRGEDDARWKAALGLPCNLTVEIPVSGFTVIDLIELRMESVIGSECLTTGNLPLKVRVTGRSGQLLQMLPQPLQIGLKTLSSIRLNEQVREPS